MKKTVEKDYNLTNKQKEVLKFIKQFSAKNKYPPSVRQICSAMELKSPATVHVHINHLIKKGILKRSNQGNHLLELLIPNEYDVKSEEVVNVPLLGKIKAGNPIEAIEVPNEFFSLPSYLIPKKKEVFTLEVDGDSMINAGIYDGDIVIVERCEDALDGEIVVAMDDENEVTLKRFYKEKNHIRLQPENDLMNPIILDNVNILGKAIGLYRKF